MKAGTRRDDGRLGAPEVAALIAGTHDDPFAVLGPHQVGGAWVARALIPGAETVSAATLDGRKVGDLERRDSAGFFEGKVSLTRGEPLRYSAANAGGQWSVVDPYSFGPVLGPMDDYYSAEGTHLRLFDRLGAHVIAHDGATGVHFAVWAPNARRVSVVGDFNAWDGRRHVMRRRISSGMWEIFLPGLAPGTVYKYEIVGANP